MKIEDVCDFDRDWFGEGVVRIEASLAFVVRPLTTGFFEPVEKSHLQKSH
jgi:hypothetical protein